MWRAKRYCSSSITNRTKLTTSRRRKSRHSGVENEAVVFVVVVCCSVPFGMSLLLVLCGWFDCIESSWHAGARKETRIESECGGESVSGVVVWRWRKRTNKEGERDGGRKRERRGEWKKDGTVIVECEKVKLLEKSRMDGWWDTVQWHNEPYRKATACVYTRTTMTPALPVPTSPSTIRRHR